MSAGASGAARRYCGREFSAAEFARIRQWLRLEPALNRNQLSRRLCQEFDWRNAAGQLKEMSCRVALLRMQADELLQLPKPLNKNGNGRTRPALTPASAPGEPVQAPVRALEPLQFQTVQAPGDSRLWNELIERHHYLGYTPMSGAQRRYLVRSREGRLLAALSFGASAWQIQPRERYIGWTDAQRRRGLHLILNNARFLILPWITAPGLASRILSGILPTLLKDWRERYACRPVLLETFVQTQRFTGVAYQAANWVCVGQTQGRGKLEKHRRQICPIKQIWLYPLHPRFRQILRA